MAANKKIDEKDLVFINEQWTAEEKKAFSDFLKLRKEKEQSAKMKRISHLPVLQGRQGRQIGERLGNALYLIPFLNPWQNLFERRDKFTPDFMEDRNQPEEQKREAFD